MRPLLVVLVLLVSLRCAAPAPPPVAAPSTPPPPPPVAAKDTVVGTVTVTASALNVRAEASGDAELLAQVKKGTSLPVLAHGESWTKVRLDDGQVGWVATRFVTEPGSKSTRGGSTSSKRKSGCPADSDFAFLEAPTPRFSDSGAHGLVVVEATVSSAGKVTSTKLIRNTTGDETLAFLTEREIKAAKFSPPIRNCVPKAFIYTYRRTF